MSYGESWFAQIRDTVLYGVGYFSNRCFLVCGAEGMPVASIFSVRGQDICLVSSKDRSPSHRPVLHVSLPLGAKPKAAGRGRERCKGRRLGGVGTRLHLLHGGTDQEQANLTLARRIVLIRYRAVETRNRKQSSKYGFVCPGLQVIVPRDKVACGLRKRSSPGQGRVFFIYYFLVYETEALTRCCGTRYLLSPILATCKATHTLPRVAL